MSESDTSAMKGLYQQGYFTTRAGNDPKRQAAFVQDAALIRKYVQRGNLLDVGCSTGEFIDALQWQGDCYGMEISDFAAGEARKRGVRFETHLGNAADFFDLVVFRGTIQHVDTPFLYMKQASVALKPGGYMFFLATPNANSLYYKLWNTLPALDPKMNFFIPADHVLVNALKNFGFDPVETRHPYLESPYASPWRDHWNFVLKCLGRDVRFPFWRNMMDVVVRKPQRA